jgi:hypothetical protein
VGEAGMSDYQPMSERQHRAIVNRQYRLPYQLQQARERLCELEAEHNGTMLSAEGRVIRSERNWRLPAMIGSVRKKLSALENEARRYGMDELLNISPEDINRAWEREVAIARLRNSEGGK